MHIYAYIRIISKNVFYAFLGILFCRNPQVANLKMHHAIYSKSFAVMQISCKLQSNVIPLAADKL